MEHRSFHTALLKAARALELAIAAAIVVSIACGGLLLLWRAGHSLLFAPDSFSVGEFLSGALLLVMGAEFVKLLALHTADAALDVLLFTIVRQMIVSHTDAVETLLGVAAVAGIFAIKKFLRTREDAEEDRR